MAMSLLLSVLSLDGTAPAFAEARSRSCRKAALVRKRRPRQFSTPLQAARHHHQSRQRSFSSALLLTSKDTVVRVLAHDAPDMTTHAALLKLVRISLLARLDFICDMGCMWAEDLNLFVRGKAWTSPRCLHDDLPRAITREAFNRGFV